ncbi:MAG TPA: GGDEF domain-containing protein [Xanthobacteraceae bacterium]|nr:GGDEF domain-containing protein [Xanthobacteraceae bacterium]
MADHVVDDRAVVLSDAPAGSGETRIAATVIAVSTLIFLTLVPFAKVPLTPYPAFIPMYQSALVINDLVTVAFLLGQSQFSRGRALTVLAGGYLFTALISMAHALTFPGLVSPTGLLGAGPQTTAWLYIFWHGGFPLIVIIYARLASEQTQTQPRPGVAMLTSAAAVCAAVFGLTLLATAGQSLLPAIMRGNHYTAITIVVVSSVWTLNLLAVGVLWQRRPLSILDLWLIVVLCAWLFDIALSAMFNAGRFDLGFYAGRLYGLAAASLVLVVLLGRNSTLYLELIRLHYSEREKAAELARLSRVDALTGIANRRAFDEALDQEWRRMLRHGTALSLLMIDVDCFKRYNDAYGHVAGDQCLRTVARVVASRARRAGELAARYGGEEFAVLLPQTDIAGARTLADFICAAVREREIPHEQSVAAPHVTVSIGVASIGEFPDVAAAFSREGVEANALSPGATVLVETADHALYAAKGAGRDRVAAAGPNDAAVLLAAGELVEAPLVPRVERSEAREHRFSRPALRESG